MKLGLQLGYDDPKSAVALAQEADRLGFHSAWTSEAYGTDAVTVASWIAATTEQIGIGTAIMQMPARTPAATAMTVATLDHLSGGRVLLGLGTSGPQVVEGWHGVAWGKPLGRTREYVEIVRSALRRETVEHHGPHYDIPYSGDGATGLGKPLKLIVKPLRARRPDLPRRDRAEERRARGRDRGRLDPDLLLAAALPGGARPLARARARRLRRGAALPRRRRRRRPDVPRPAEADARALRRRHGRTREELLQHAHPALRLRGGRGSDPGALPRRAEGRGGDGGSGRARRRGRARRAEGADRGAARGLARGGDLDDGAPGHGSPRRSR